jgi:dihydropyrimidine dehydrogenase (NADP+)/dihydropyrimidine dehydrogenase (NAD+) subunit PreA
LDPKAQASVLAPWLSAHPGVVTGNDAAQFMLLGSDIEQVGTGVMKFGYHFLREMRASSVYGKNNFETLSEFKVA